jgi:tetratricopeptide (TPR) repeat protein
LSRDIKIGELPTRLKRNQTIILLAFFLLVVITVLAVALYLHPDIKDNPLFVALGFVATVFPFFIMVWQIRKLDKPEQERRKETKAENIAAPLPGPHTNVTGGVQGDVLSGNFNGPTSSGGDAGDNRGSIGLINKPNGPVNQQFIDKVIIGESEKLPIPRIQPPSSDFVGREVELKELIANFDRGATITGLRGMGGIGKTELALAIAARLKDRFPDGQLFLNMLGTSKSPLKPEDAMAHIIRSYRGVDAPLPEDLNGLSGLYQSVLSGKKALILLDNAASREQVEPLMPPAGSAVLITSRNKFALPGLKEKDLDVLPLEDAKKLLLEIAGRIGEHAEELAKLCGCLPLALRNAAYALKEKPNIGVADYMERLGDARKRLELVDASFSLSYDLLTPELQRLWCLLSVFAADFDLEGAAAVWETEQIPAEDALGELVKWSLVDFLASATGEGGRYRLHDLARVFVDLQLNDAAREPAKLRHASYYQKLLWSANELFLQGKDSLSMGLKLFDINWINIESGQKWVSENRSKGNEIAEICSNFAGTGSILNLRLHPLRNIEWLEAALVAARNTKDKNAEGTHLGNLGRAYFDLGETRKAIEFYEQSLKIAREIGDWQGEGNGLGSLGSAYVHLGETRKAIEFYEQALKTAREIEDMRNEGNSLGNLGSAYVHLGETHKAIEYYEQALKISRVIGDRRGEGDHLFNMSLSLNNLDQRAKAIDLAKSALKIYEQIESPYAERVQKKIDAWQK